jgi:hypothetical protein
MGLVLLVTVEAGGPLTVYFLAGFFWAALFAFLQGVFEKTGWLDVVF